MREDETPLTPGSPIVVRWSQSDREGWDDQCHFRLKGECTVAGVAFSHTSPVHGPVLKIGDGIEYARKEVVKALTAGIQKRRAAAIAEAGAWEREGRG